jgi:predicted dehydrogenase
VGLIGAGVFASYHAQKVVESDVARLMGIYDLSVEAAQRVVEKVGEGEAVEDLDRLILACDAIIVATPAVTHVQYASKALRAGKHVLVEKPLALTAEEADALVALADQKNLVLQVGHQERLVFEAMGILGTSEIPTRLEAVRESPPSPTGRCEDVSVVFDLMVHDLDLANALFKSDASVSTASGRVQHSEFLDDVEAAVSYENGGEAKFKASRCASERKRTMKIEFPSGVVEIDFLARKVKNETPMDIQLDVSDILPDPLLAADSAFFIAALGQGDSPIPGVAGAKSSRLANEIEKAAQ